MIINILPHFVTNYSAHGERYWIGLFKVLAVYGDNTEWHDGNPSKFRKWGHNEPNSNSICFTYMADKFADMTCSYNYKYICKKATGNFLTTYILTYLHTVPVSYTHLTLPTNREV